MSEIGNTEILSIIIYVLAAVLTVLIFRGWKQKKTDTRHIVRVLLWILVGFVVLVAAGCVAIFCIETDNEFNFNNLLQAIYRVIQLPMFSFAYFMWFIGIIWLLRERRRKKLKPTTEDKPKNKKH